MYYANRTLKIKNPQGEYVFRKMGEALPEALTWDKRVLSANLEAGHVVLKLEVPEEGQVAESAILEAPVQAEVKRKRGRPKKQKD